MAYTMTTSAMLDQLTQTQSKMIRQQVNDWEDYNPKTPTKTDEKVDWDEFFDDINDHEKATEKATEDLKTVLMERFNNDILTEQYNGMQLNAQNLGKMITDSICDYDKFKQQQKEKPRTKNYCKVKD